MLKLELTIKHKHNTDEEIYRDEYVITAVASAVADQPSCQHEVMLAQFVVEWINYYRRGNAIVGVPEKFVPQVEAYMRELDPTGKLQTEEDVMKKVQPIIKQGIENMRKYKEELAKKEIVENDEDKPIYFPFAEPETPTKH